MGVLSKFRQQLSETSVAYFELYTVLDELNNMLYRQENGKAYETDNVKSKFEDVKTAFVRADAERQKMAEVCDMCIK